MLFLLGNRVGMSRRLRERQITTLLLYMASSCLRYNRRIGSISKMIYKQDFRVKMSLQNTIFIVTGWNVWSRCWFFKLKDYR